MAGAKCPPMAKPKGQKTPKKNAPPMGGKMPPKSKGY